MSLIDIDWSSLAFDVGDDPLSDRVRMAMTGERNRPSNVGSRLDSRAHAAGSISLARTARTHEWTTWNPNESPAPDGCFSMESLADDLVTAGQLVLDERSDVVSTVKTAALDGRFAMRITMFAVVAVSTQHP